MSLPQQKLREVIFQLLYSQDLGKAKADDMIALLMNELAITKKKVKEGQDKLAAIQSHQNDIDAIIAKTSTSYAFERIQSVERNILRLGVYELLYDVDIPPKVAIAEAMRLARKFGSPESAAFVNAILDNVYKVSQGIKIDEDSLSESAEALAEIEEISREASQNQPLQKETTDEP
jgi:N utilization substance protein B